MKKITYIILVASILLMLSVFFVKINHYAGFHTVWMISIISFLLLLTLILVQMGLKIFKKATN